MEGCSLVDDNCLTRCNFLRYTTVTEDYLFADYLHVGHTQAHETSETNCLKYL